MFAFTKQTIDFWYVFRSSKYIIANNTNYSLYHVGSNLCRITQYIKMYFALWKLAQVDVSQANFFLRFYIYRDPMLKRVFYESNKSFLRAHKLKRTIITKHFLTMRFYEKLCIFVHYTYSKVNKKRFRKWCSRI